jgi:formylmethanofuran dehydrogenase subunit E
MAICANCGEDAGNVEVDDFGEVFCESCLDDDDEDYDYDDDEEDSGTDD